MELQSSQFQSELEKTNQKLLGFQRQATTSLSSIDKQAKQFGKSLTGTLRGINAAMGFLIGVGFKKAFQGIFAETAASSKEFADALSEVKRSAKDLLSAKDGAPAAAASLRELSEVLKDPVLVQAADDLTSTLIRGFASAATGIAETIGGLKVLMGLTGDEVEDLRIKIDKLDYQIANRRVAAKNDERIRKELEALQAERDALVKQQMSAAERGPPARDEGVRSLAELGLSNNLSGFDAGELNVESELRDQMKEFQRRENINPIDHLQEQLEEFIDTLKGPINEGITDSAQLASASIEEVADTLGDKLIGKAADLSVFAEEAARNIQGAFADFLFDPFEDGAKGMLKGFVDVIRRMASEAAAAKIFESLFGTGTGGKSGFGSFLSGLFGGFKAEGGPLQQGKWYIAGEHGPEPVWGGGNGAFAMGYGGGNGMSVHVENHFHNMKDVTDAKMAQYGKLISDSTVARIKDERRRGKF